MYFITIFGISKVRERNCTTDFPASTIGEWRTTKNDQKNQKNRIRTETDESGAAKTKQ